MTCNNIVIGYYWLDIGVKVCREVNMSWNVCWAYHTATAIRPTVTGDRVQQHAHKCAIRSLHCVQ